MRQTQTPSARRSKIPFIISGNLRQSSARLWLAGLVLWMTAGVAKTYAQDASTIVYVDALWQRVHAADCPDLILKDLKQTMTLGQADQLGYRIGESGQSGRTDCCLHGYTRQYPQATIPDNALGVAEVRPGDVLKYHVHGCHRFTPKREDYRMTKAEVMATSGNYVCEHCIERGPGIAQMSQEAWDSLPSSAPWVAPIGWGPSPFPVDAYPDQEEIGILLSQTLHGDPGIQERTFIDPVATVDNFVIMRFFFPVHRWLELYMAYRTTGDTDVLEQLRESARNYNTLSQNYLSAAQYKARDPEGMAYMYTMAASARITLQLAQKYPGQVTAGELAEAEAFLMTIMSVLQPTCEGSSNLDPVMGIPQPLADDFRTRAFNRALNGIGTIGMTVAALEDLQALNNTTEYQSTIDRYRLIIQQYIINWKNTGFYETFEGNDYFSYPYSATDNGSWNGDVKLFGADDKGHFSHSMQGCYILYDSVPELGVDDAFMTAIANTIEFNSYTTSGSPQTPSQEAIRPYSRKPYSSEPSERMYLLQAFNSGVIDGQNSALSTLSRESTNSQFAFRLATFNALYLKEKRLDTTLIHLGEDSVAPPAPPTGLSGTGSNGQVTLDWDDNTESDMASGTYTVYRSTVSGSGYTQIATGLSASAYVDNDVVNDTLYFYAVTATDSNSDTSSSSVEAFAAPFVVNGTPPSAPTGLGASATDGSVTLDWADNGEVDLNSYNVYRSTTTGSYGLPIATVTSSDYLDTDVVNGIPYHYVVRAVDHSGNLSLESDEVSATPASYGPTITFGSTHDGDGGFIPSGATGTEVWTISADSMNYAFGLPATDEGHTASLLKSYVINRTVGSSYTVEGVVDLTDGYGDDNNRIGLLLFNTAPTQTGDGGGGLYLRLNADDGRDIAINTGINGASLASTSTGVSNGDAWIGQALTFSADLDFVDVAGVDKIDITFTLTDGNLNTYSASAQVDADAYPGTYFGFATKWRQRGDGGSRDAPPVFDFKNLSVIDHTPVVNDPPVFTSNPIVEENADEGSGYESSIADNATDPDSDPLTFAKISGPAWLTVIANGDLIGTPTSGDVGLNSFTVSVSDGIAPPVQATLEITVDAAPVNQAPSFSTDPIVEAGATEDAAYSATIADNATDPESDPMTFTKVSGPAWLSVASNGALSGTPGNSDTGLNSFTVQVDAVGGNDTATLEITVEALPNLPPSFTSDPMLEADADEDTAYSSSIADNASDPESDPMTFSKISGPAWLSVAANGALSGTPSSGDVGLNSFTVQVNATGGSDTAELQIMVQAGGALWTPASMTTAAWYDAGDASTIIDTSGVVSQWNDKSGNGLHLSQGTAGKQPAVDTNAINSLPVINFDGGDDELSTSSNPFGSTISDAFVIAVHRVDSASNKGTLFTLTGSSGSRWQAHAPWSGTAYFDCGGTGGGSRVNSSYGVSNGDSVMVSFYGSVTDGVQQIVKNGAVLVGDTSGHSVSTVGNLFLGSAGSTQYQNTSIGEVIIVNGTVSIDDRQKLEGYLAHKWGLAANLPAGHPYRNAAPRGGANQAPVFASNPVVEAGATEDAPYSGTVADNASDPESDPMTFAKISGPAWLSVASNGDLSGTPSNSDVGLNSFTIEVSDGNGGTDSATLEIAVANFNDAPVFTAYPIVGAGAIEDSAYAGSIAGSASDVDVGDSLSYSKTSGPAWLSVASNGDLSGTPSNSDVGLNSFTIEVSDGNGGNDTATLEITVDAAPSGLQVNINFQPSGAPVPGGYLVDSGSPFADRGNGFSYGWDTSVNETRDRNNHADQRYDTLNHMQKTSGRYWEVALPNGDYDVFLVMGDPSHTDQVNTIDVEGVVMTDPDGQDHFDEYTLTVTVTDGRMTLTPAAGSSNAKICYIEISEAGAPVNQVNAPEVVTETAGNITLDSADVGFTVVDEGGETPTVFLFHGESDGGTTPANWDNSQNLGALTAGSYAVTLDTLSEGTTYYYSVQAFNSSGLDWGTTVSFTTDVDTSPKLVRSVVSGVTDTWQTFDLGQSYTSAVIIATPVLPDSSHPPVVTRLQNVSGNTFDLKIERVDGLTGSLSVDVSVIAVEEGIYTQATDGVTLEAVKMTSTVTAENTNWSSETRTYQNTYTNPVVVGQVMSANDPLWSVFWCQGSSRGNAPDGANLRVGKHVGEDSITSRADETLGYIVIESGTGTINGVAFTAGLGSDTVRGTQNTTTGFTYSLTGLSSASAAAVSLAGMDGADGGFASLFGATPFSSTSVTLVADEDQLGDSERSHTTEEAGYLVFE